MFGPIASLENYVLRAFNFSGRATRAEFWWASTLVFLIFVGAIFMDGITFANNSTVSFSPFAYFTPWLALATIVPNLSLTVRRLHDTGRSGLWYLVQFVPIVGPLLLLFFVCMPSKDDTNLWGAPRSPGIKATTADGKHNPYAGYAYLVNGNADPSPELVARRKAEVQDYYRSQILGEADDYGAELDGSAPIPAQ